MARRELMSNVDRAWLRMEAPSNLMMVTALLTTKEKLRYEDVLDLLKERLMIFDRFRQRVVNRGIIFEDTYWEDVPFFDPADHISLAAIPNEDPRAELQALVGELMSTPLDYDKPLWHITMVEDVRQGTGLIIRLHHCIADGNALVRVLLSMMTTDKAILKPGRKTKKEERPTFLDPVVDVALNVWVAAETMVKLSYRLLKKPSKVFDWAKMTIDGGFSLGRLVLRWPDPKTLLKQDLQNKKLASWSFEIPLERVKEIRRGAGATVNDVVVTAAAGALGRYLKNRGEDISEMNIRAAIPVDIRRATDPFAMGNKFGLVFLSLPVGMEDIRERLTEQKRRMDELKNTPEAFVSFMVLNTMGAAPREIENLVLDVIGSKTSLVLTNVPGPSIPLYLGGCEVDNILFWVPQAGRVGLGISVISYNNKVRIGVATDANIIPDPSKIVDDFERELDAMHALFASPEAAPSP
ncbi:MAG: wax ester/triacylglycerol synthase family O-acyltransferase [Candidatus Cyclonatronum sp.]|uniref:wax ester/triacylglycerol synthase family O-acyltransferase n=1 Tax=Cyclonatronum sp. TaxID=3024185 RepID=UPI0025B9D42E|nr:wax ester/triacylglycerol synthase family O-acyltransferase [Cyclonatronum sp.]MCH8486824.1 wax ester/triacylglycerol synthase family O-acyltransferase [Cyclonatronum sp.]